MGERKTRTKKGASKAAGRAAPTREYPLPPAREGTKDLGVDVADSIAHRIKLARYYLDVRCGMSLTKRATVEELLVFALDAFDENPELVFRRREAA